MSRIHLSFRNLNSEAVAAADAFFRAKPWEQERAEQTAIAQAFVDEASRVYGLPTATVEITEPDIYEGDVSYYPAEANDRDEEPVEGESNTAAVDVVPARIVLRKWSNLNLFAAFRFHLINHGADEKSHDPWGWAASIFYAARPVAFRKLVRTGKIRKGLTPKDTYSSSTFVRMVAAGVATERGDVLIPNFDPRLLEAIEAGDVDVRSLFPEGRSYNPTALSAWDDDEDGLDDLLDDDDEEDTYLPDGPEQDDSDGPTEDPEDEFLSDSDEEDDEDEAVAEAVNQTVEVESIVPRPGERPSEAVMRTLSERAAADDGLDALGITALRQLSRGHVTGGYSLRKPELIAALRQAGVRA